MSNRLSKLPLTLPKILAQNETDSTRKRKRNRWIWQIEKKKRKPNSKKVGLLGQKKTPRGSEKEREGEQAKGRTFIRASKSSKHAHLMFMLANPELLTRCPTTFIMFHKLFSLRAAAAAEKTGWEKLIRSRSDWGPAFSFHFGGRPEHSRELFLFICRIGEDRIGEGLYLRERPECKVVQHAKRIVSLCQECDKSLSLARIFPFKEKKLPFV